jgi:hypothetical protein
VKSNHAGVKLYSDQCSGIKSSGIKYISTKAIEGVKYCRIEMLQGLNAQG